MSEFSGFSASSQTRTLRDFDLEVTYNYCEDIVRFCRLRILYGTAIFLSNIAILTLSVSLYMLEEISTLFSGIIFSFLIIFALCLVICSWLLILLHTRASDKRTELRELDLRVDEPHEDERKNAISSLQRLKSRVHFSIKTVYISALIFIGSLALVSLPRGLAFVPYMEGPAEVMIDFTENFHIIDGPPPPPPPSRGQPTPPNRLTIPIGRPRCWNGERVDSIEDCPEDTRITCWNDQQAQNHNLCPLIPITREGRTIRSLCSEANMDIYYSSNGIVTEIGSTARRLLDVVISRIDYCRIRNITVIGRSDTAGTHEEAMFRAEANALATRDFIRSKRPDVTVNLQLYGDYDLRRQTADNVLEPLNRVIEIELRTPNVATLTSAYLFKQTSEDSDNDGKPDRKDEFPGDASR